MERIMTHVGGSSGGSVVSREEEDQQQSNKSTSNMCVSSDEVCSYPDEAKLQLGLGLSLSVGGSGGNKQRGPRILTAKDLPCMGLTALKPSPPSASSSSSSCLGGDGGRNYHASSAAGIKRPAETSPTGVSHVVGWPPVRAYRVNSLANQAKTVTTGEVHPNKRDEVICSTEDKGKANHNDIGHLRGSLFVKVNMDGIGIGRKIDLHAHACYESLARTLEEMFDIPTKSNTITSNREESVIILKAKLSPRLLDGCSDFVLTYEDKDGDWMLVGDVPWGLFLSSVKRLRIMKRSEAIGLGE